ncbi:MAG: hypothetical protein A4E28_01019 [Methanocella sp. PtaU1.Bin125]|nr:MAG: hypothetical protein A4E28_01019 [Methanocella sp. PtaU1.Bin125]
MAVSGKPLSRECNVGEVIMTLKEYKPGTAFNGEVGRTAGESSPA